MRHEDRRAAPCTQPSAPEGAVRLVQAVVLGSLGACVAIGAWGGFLPLP